MCSGADCNQTALVLEAIKQTKVDMKIYAAIYIPVDDDTAYTRQKDELEKAIRTYGVDHIEGISVGNEYMLNYVTLNGGEGSGVDGAVGLAASRNLKTHITETRQMMSDLGFGNVPIGTADAGAYFNTDLLGAIDFGLSNIHAWFAPTTAAGATEWTNTFFEDQNVTPARAVSNHPTMVIAETGWPTHSNGTATENSGAGPGGEASVANLQTFLDDFICAANRASTPYFMFEYSDVPWKDIRFGGVEGYWGMFDKNKRLKDLTLPDCSHP
jgi:exo-beta-1,3-glucanase (GH17 family)